jgi:hypothetical protein
MHLLEIEQAKDRPGPASLVLQPSPWMNVPTGPPWRPDAPEVPSSTDMSEAPVFG